MANIKVSSITKKEPPCPGPAPKKPKKFQPAPTDPPGTFPPPPPFFAPGPCCPSTTQIVDNITVVSTTPETIEVQEGTCQGMKAYGVGANTFAGIGTSGMVPVPQPGDENKVLAGDGSWAEIIIKQSDWEQDDPSEADYIRNKPDIEAMMNAATTEVRAGENASVDEEIAADGHYIYTVNADGKPQVQADWAQTDQSATDFIKNKPGAFAGATAQTAGKMGFVPAPGAGSQEMFLRGDGSWANVDNTRECTAQEMDDWIDEVEQYG